MLCASINVWYNFNSSFVHLLPLGGQLDPNNIKGISINFVCNNCTEEFKVFVANVCCYNNFEIKMFIYQLYKPQSFQSSLAGRL